MPFKNKFSHIVRSITAASMSQEQQQNGGAESSAKPVPAMNGTTNGTSAASEVNSGDLVRFLELVGNLKVRDQSPDRKM